MTLAQIGSFRVSAADVFCLGLGVVERLGGLELLGLGGRLGRRQRRK
jgi:hypothetical protein